MADYLEDRKTLIKRNPQWLKPLPFNGYTHKDYMSWDDGIRAELIDGIPYMMAPPSINHQRLVKNLTSQLDGFLKNKPCEVLMAPTGVRLFPQDNEEDQVTVEPDVFVVWDEKKLSGGQVVNGAPDFIIEVLSPSTKAVDLVIKKELYEKAGVKEYWIAGEDLLYRYILIDNIYSESIHKLFKGFKLEVFVLKGCVLTF